MPPFHYPVEKLRGILQTCRHIRSLVRAVLLRNHCHNTGLNVHLSVSNELISIFLELGNLSHANQIYERLEHCSVCTLNSLIISHVNNDQHRQALMLYDKMQESASGLPSEYVFITILKSCTVLKDFNKGCEIHSHIMNLGLIEGNPFICSALVDMYAKCDCISKAQEVFDSFSSHTVVMWNTLITGYIRSNLPDKVFSFPETMQNEGISPDDVTFVCMLKACSDTRNLTKGQEFHADILNRGLEGNTIVGSALMDMYSKCGYIDDVQSIFDSLPHQSVVMWNALINGYAEYEFNDRVLEKIEKMKDENVSPNGVTFLSVLKSCNKIGAICKGQEIHTEIVKKGVDKCLEIGSTLINMYAKFGCLSSAKVLLDKLRVQDTIMWNAFISGLLEHGQHLEVSECVEDMKYRKVSPDSVTFIFSLKACSNVDDIEKVQKIHSEIVVKGLETDPFASSALVDVYAKCCLLQDAEEVVKKSPSNILVAWNALIARYTENGCAEEALNLIGQVKNRGMCADPVTLLSTLKAFSILHDVVKIQEIHAEIVKKGVLDGDEFLGSTLVDVYGKCGLFAEAREVFEKLLSRDDVSWTAMIVGSAEYGEAEKVISLLNQFKYAVIEGMSINVKTFGCILKAICFVGLKDEGLEIHTEITKRGYLEEDFSIGCALVEMYAKCGSSIEAKCVFDQLSIRDVVAWTSIIECSLEHIGPEESLQSFAEMNREGVPPSIATLVLCLKACCNLADVKKGQEIHIEITKRGLEGDACVATALIHMYGICGFLDDAETTYVSVTTKDQVLVAALFVAYIDNELGEEGLIKFHQLSDVSLGHATIVCCLKACANIGAIVQGRVQHSHLVKKGFESDSPVVSMLLDMYIKCGLLLEAHVVFEKLSVHNIFSWNILIAGYLEHQNAEEAFNCLDKLKEENIPLDVVTLVNFLKACATMKSIERGKEVHIIAVRNGLDTESDVRNTLVDMYAKCGSLVEALAIFDKIPVRNVVSYTVLISGYVECSLDIEALSLLEQMQNEGFSLSIVTYICSLKACRSTTTIVKGRELHSQIIKRGYLECDIFLGSTLVDMYINCGALTEAQVVFDDLPLTDLVSWTALIAGCMETGYGEEALDCFEKMTENGFPSDAVTLVCVLKSCSILGAIDKGKQLHSQVVKKGFERDLLVGEVLVDMYAKCGLVSAAQEIFKGLPDHDIMLWNALIAGYSQLGDDENVHNVLNRMISTGVNADLATHVNFLTMCSHAGLVDEGMLFFQGINHNSDITLALEHYSCMVDLLGRAGCIKQMVHLAKNMPFNPDSAVWLTILGASRKWGIVELGREAFDHSLEFNENDAAAYISMFNVYAASA